MSETGPSPNPRDIERFSQRGFRLPRDAYARYLELLSQSAGSDIAYLYRYDGSEQLLELAAVSAAVQADLDPLAEKCVPLAKAGAWADCIRSGAPVVFQGYPAAAASPLPGLDLSLRPHIAVPLAEGGEVVALVGVADVPTATSDAVAGQLMRSAEAAWPALQMHLEVCPEPDAGERFSGDEVLEEMVRAIAGAIELREAHSAHHQQNVAHLCDCVAREIGLDEHARRGLAIGASLHDIGKIAVPSELLNKPGDVSATEFTTLQTHAEVGANLFRSLVLPWPIVDMIAQHHERMDGSGYPAGLQREEICEAARIIAIADSYDAIASDRPYRRSRGTAEALRVLREGRGKLFDAYLVDAFLRCAAPDPGFVGRYSTA